MNLIHNIPPTIKTPENMGTALIVLVLASLILVDAATKVEESAWNNLLQISGDVDIKSNDVTTGRSDSDGSLEDHIERYIKSHEISFDVPIIGSKVTLEAKNLDNTELNMMLNFGSEVQARKKSKLKKIFVPILIFILIKAMTLIPLALGVLGLKAWNAIQLSFVSFVSALAMAVWKLCSKVGHPHHHHQPHIVHDAWDAHAHLHDRSDVGQQMAYGGYAPQ